MTDRYTHISLHDERAALEDLPDLSLSSSEQQAVKTGTDDKDFLPNSCFRNRQQQTPVGAGGQRNLNSVQRTQLSTNNKGVVQSLNQQVVGSSPASPTVIVTDAERLVYPTSH